MTIDELRQEVLRLDVKDRADLAKDLLDSLDDLTEAEIEQLWLDEALRRKAELEAGTAVTVSAEEALARAPACLK